MPGVWGAIVGTVFQGFPDTPSLRETGRQIASILGIFLLAGLWLYLRMHANSRFASLVVVGILALATGAGYALGRESRVEFLREGLSSILLFLEVLIALPRFDEVFRVVAMFLVAGVAGIVVGQTLALYVSNGTLAGEVIVELLVILFF
ncbi:MAG TPA: hypothetical protein VGC13_00960 [Longimicrobium sp.]|jgi:hypothetical protein|uniref:hypothetical protein n=1 Tax=Longimicrobium sp. TaxID=2029185 RepID=UPI002ED84124